MVYSGKTSFYPCLFPHVPYLPLEITIGLTLFYPGLGIQNEAAQSLAESCQRKHRSQQMPFSNNPRWLSTHGHQQMVKTKARLIMFFGAKDGEALHSQQKQILELTLAQIMSSLLQNSDFEENEGNQ